MDSENAFPLHTKNSQACFLRGICHANTIIFWQENEAPIFHFNSSVINEV